MRRYSKKLPPVKAHEGATQRCRVLFPVEFGHGAQGANRPEEQLSGAGVTHALSVVFAFFIGAEDRVAQAISALDVRQLIHKARGAYPQVEPGVQVIIYFLAHIHIVFPHILVPLIPHVNHNVASLVRRRRATDSSHGA